MRRGFTLIAVLWFAGFTLLVTLASAVIVDGVRSRLAHSKMEQAARLCATSGADYAETMLKWKRWPGTTFTSPDLNGSGSFTVTVTGHRVHSVGEAGGVHQTVDRTVAP